MRAAMLLILLIAIAVLVATGTAVADEPASVSYNRDVRPILADRCFHCHGPDGAAREADLRLDLRDDAVQDRGHYKVIDPQQPQQSELLARITSPDADVRMPPHGSGPPLTDSEVHILRRWIAGGAEYEPHWSFLPPQRSTPPVDDSGWSRNPIDRFMFARLLHAGLQPSSPAQAATLIRRASLDVTGLPPTILELDRFEGEYRINPEAAYERLLDRLLASPRYGERMALGWLDAARYADTNGYFTDNDRSMWLWRDWVIDAFNRNMPFDQFTIEQLAGDLLPQATIGQKIATGFNRNHMVNNESGIIEEEFRVEYVVDRADTTASVWMGLTLGCARCHDHKYDPVSQRDFYRFFAFFNNVPERGLSGSQGNSSPLIKVASIEQQARIDELQKVLAAADREYTVVEPQLDAAQSAWEQVIVDRLPPTPTDGLMVHEPLDSQPPPSSITGSVKHEQGMIEGAADFSGNGVIRSTAEVPFDRDDAFSFGAWINAHGAGCILSKTDDTGEMRGFDITLRKGHAVINLVHGWNRNAIQVVTTATVPSGQWQHLMVTYDGSGRAVGVRVYRNGEPQDVTFTQDTLTGTIQNDEPLRIGRRQSSASFTGLIDDLRIYNRTLTEQEVADLATGQMLRGIISRPVDQRSSHQSQQLRNWFVEHDADPELATTVRRRNEARERLRQSSDRIPTTMVMQDTDQSRPTHILMRGEYDKPGEEVSAGIPEFLAFNRDASTNIADRLGLAQWLVDPDHPLTARVTVNRLWQQVFGTGIVKTADDFGTQGEWPSHPELLDWLAVELVESGWDVKHILRLMLTSATYRQSSVGSQRQREIDPDNRLLSHSPRLRMPAEMLRDNALTVSGLLVETLGGPSVMPYQPDGLWEDVTYDSDRAYHEDGGGSLHRRSLYTFWKRQQPPPNMLVFDATTRETCIVQRSRTNTPLQALVLMNDPTFVEAARRLAERVMHAGVDSPKNRIVLAFRAATSRRPSTSEVEILLDVFQQQRDVYRADPQAAAELLSVGEASVDESLDVVQLGAWTTVTSMILSLDETITRP